MFCDDNMFGNLKSILNRSMKFGIVLLMNFSLINGMESDSNIKNNHNDADKVVTATYKLSKGVDNIYIFDSVFVKNNKDNFKMCINGEERELVSEFNVNGVNADSNNLVVSLFYKDGRNNNVTTLSKMFYFCNSLIDVKFYDTFNTSNVTNMSNMFSGCIQLIMSKGVREKFNK